MNELFGVDVRGLILGATRGQLRPIRLRKIVHEVDEFGDPRSTATAFAGEGVRSKWKTETLIQRGFPANTVKIIVLQDGLPEPSQIDEIECMGERYRILDIEKDPVDATWVIYADRIGRAPAEIGGALAAAASVLVRVNVRVGVSAALPADAAASVKVTVKTRIAASFNASAGIQAADSYRQIRNAPDDTLLFDFSSNIVAGKRRSNAVRAADASPATLVFDFTDDSIAASHPAASSAGPYDIIFLGTQSNEFYGLNDDGSPGVDAVRDAPGPNLFQLKQNLTIAAAEEPLDHDTYQAGKIGHTVKWIREHYIPRYLTPGRSVLLVPCARGSTAFSTSPRNWNAGNSLYLEAVSRCNYAMGLHPENQFVCFDICGFDSDGGAGMSYETFAPLFDDFIARLRSEITGASNAKLLIFGTPPDRALNNPLCTPVYMATKDAPSRIPHAAFVDPDRPTRIRSNAQDTVHYSAQSQRHLATRAAAVFDTILRGHNCPSCSRAT